MAWAADVELDSQLPSGTGRRTDLVGDPALSCAYWPLEEVLGGIAFGEKVGNAVVGAVEGADEGGGC